MRKNIYIKTMLRQPVRTILLFLLIGLAAFAFTLRAVEFVSVSRHVDAIGANYRSIGVLMPQAVPGFSPVPHGDVSAGAEILANSPMVQFEDRRRHLEASLVSTTRINPHFADPDFDSINGIEYFVDDSITSPDILGMVRGVPVEDQIRPSVVYFYGVVSPMLTGPPGGWWYLERVCRMMQDYGMVRFAIQIIEPVAGQQEHAGFSPRDIYMYQMVGLTQVQSIQRSYSATWLRFYFEPGDPEALAKIDALEQSDGTYLFRAHYYRIWRTWADGTADWFFPHAGFHPMMAHLHSVVMTPIDAETDTWFLPVEGQLAQWDDDDTETYVIPPDFDALGLSHIADEIEWLNREARTVTLRTTIDMTAMQSFQGRGSFMRLVDGRLLNHNDHLNANPVAVIHTSFSNRQGIMVGDFITVDVHTNQFVDNALPESYLVRSTSDPATATTIELEVVGTFQYMRTNSDSETFRWGFIYVPDSIVPADIQVGPPIRDLSHLGVEWHDGMIPGTWYSFILESTRLEQSFLLEYRERMAELGLVLALFQAASGGFWAAADPIMLVITLNLAVFSVVLLMVLLLVAFLYLRQRRREFAIMRALGMTKGGIFVKLLLSVLILALPASAIGGWAGWTFAMNEATVVLEPLADMAAEEAPNFFDPFNRINAPAAIRAAGEVDMEYTWLFALIGVVVLLLLLIISVGYAVPLRRSILEQLQGSQTRTKPQKHAKVAADDGSVQGLVTGDLPDLTYRKVVGGKLSASFHWVKAHITRAAFKTVLGVIIALFFISALGILQETIRSTEENIDELNANTVVRGYIEPLHPQFRWMGGRVVEMGSITRAGAHILQEHPYIDRLSGQGAHLYAFIMADNHDGVAPENWDEYVGFNRGQGRAYHNALGLFETLIGVLDLEQFIDENYVGLVGDIDEGMFGSIHIDFVDGFTYEDFNYEFVRQWAFDDGPVPIIIPQVIADARGLSPGDNAFVVYALMNPLFANFRVQEAVVVGVHNEQIHATGHAQSVVIPMGALETMMGWVTFYNAVNFTVPTEYNERIGEVRSELVELVVYGNLAFAHLPLELLFLDEELRIVVGSMTQVLTLLEMLYPIAIVLAVAIGFAMSMMLMMQMAKNAAIMRVLGTSLHKTIAILCAEQLVVTLVGLVIGLGVMIALSVGFGPIELLTLGGLYFAGAVIGSLVGAIIIAAKAPLDLLQVRE